jgi:hypothetical protein
MRLIHSIVLLLAIALSPTSPVALANPSSAPAPAASARADGFTTNAFQSLLAPADTSSPRGTLRSFLTDAEIVIESMRSDGLHVNAAAFRAYQRTLTTLDFSATPEGDTRDVMNARVLMLHEILARLELPPDEEIPGVEDVARLDLRQWTIPGTPLTISRIETGPRAGEFVFSAGTVQRLPYYYRLVEHLPYRPGATPGFFEEHLRVEGSLARSAAAVRHRLKAIETSNPRSTLFGFLESVNQAHALVMETNAALAATPPRITREEVIQAENEAWLLVQRAKNTLDLSEVPEVLRRYVGVEAVLQLKEILDRQFLPPIDSIPDLEMIEAERERLSRLGVSGGPENAGQLHRQPDPVRQPASQPVRVGDFIHYGDQLGTVEKIGLLATQIRSLERTVVTVPNAEFSEMHLDNFAKRDQRLLRTVLQLRYETTPEQMRYVLAKLREMLVGHPKVTPAPARVRFVGYGAFSKDVEVFAYLYCQDQDTFLAIQEDILQALRNCWIAIPRGKTWSG